MKARGIFQERYTASEPLVAFSFPYLPAHLSTLEFMTLLNSRLSNGGVALFNVGRYKAFDQVVESISQTGLGVFQYGYRFNVKNQMNTLVYLMNHPIEAAMQDPVKRQPRLRLFARRIKQQLKFIQKTEQLISTDDRPLSEWLTNKIILQVYGGF